MFVCLGGRILDMTEWAECAFQMSKHASSIPVNTHKASYSFGAEFEGGASTPRSGKKGKKRRR